MVKGMYIHIPFCHQICFYCDFNKVFFKDQPVDAYIESIGKELALWKQEGALDHPLETVFLGGGTPTALTPQQLGRLLELIHQYVPMAEGFEWSSEANPDELTREKMEVLYKGGVNRLSMGVQTFDQDLLKRLGRTHANDDVLRAVETAREVGFSNISFDLMYGLPGQTMAQWDETLERAFAFGMPHFSAYSLIIEPKTVFYNLMVKGKLNTVTEDLEGDMYERLMEEMEKHGLHQYEISNFAKPGHESRHNLLYWDNEEYIGVGAGAHGYVNGVRYSNHGPLKKYMEPLESGERPVLDATPVSTKAQMEEEMFLGLRKTAGVDIAHFEEKFGAPLEKVYGEILRNETTKGNLAVEQGHVKLTHKGRFVGNEVFEQFLLS
ncbi:MULTISPECIES: radical SAM family heme chaperone HemW [unclassified Planococcus (in: firmicutes)]|uniref:radical SAM family heme chaperone HemW n=1 Tax=Planococcus TaxID=1372 RepID=UPI000C3210B6|nr:MULTISPECIES: radical SAM family heme chaperone HemW [unclassified Planococcus (in: firmicutes)]AUD13734.1 coproporphyrinogen III oxidase [Planococcus sp. MB-3u-03]PKG45791.1 coproporphyrinogen III oxidase [Planococcus sp. Urea-trap-24]PKG88500.1 coproporphyrinogen III oxidase [Planococcus sp. Urea-3u-39]PKH38782.1 coproporphyrinogen III oxidase [Planococcus sp. MB-3u-09]